MSDNRVTSAPMSKRRKQSNPKPETVRLNVDVLKDEHEKLQAKLAKNLSSVSQFIRECIAGYLADN